MSIDRTVPTDAPLRAGTRGRDIVTVGCLLGAVLFLVLPLGPLWAATVWAVGAGMLWTSRSWTTRDKALGTLVWPGGLIGPAFALNSVSQVCTRVAQGGSGVSGQEMGEPVCTGFALSPRAGIPLSVIIIAAPFAVAVFLLARSQAR